MINWGMIPFTVNKADIDKLTLDTYIFIPNIRKSIKEGDTSVKACVMNEQGQTDIELYMETLSQDDRDIILAGCLINYYAANKK